MAPTAAQSQFPADGQNTGGDVDVVTTVYATVDIVRKLHDAVDTEDAATADILDDHIDRLEKLALLIESVSREV